MNEYSVVMVFVSSILTLQQILTNKNIEIMKLTCKKTGKDMTSKVINQVEKSWKDKGIKIISKSPYRDENGNFINHKQ